MDLETMAHLYAYAEYGVCFANGQKAQKKRFKELQESLGLE